LQRARRDVGAKQESIKITDREWEAIQAGAISDSKFQTVIRYSDTNELKKRALPRKTVTMKATTRSRARKMLSAGYAPSTVASELGISTELLAKEFDNFKGINIEGE
jgi:hypothetical protein